MELDDGDRYKTWGIISEMTFRLLGFACQVLRRPQQRRPQKRDHQVIKRRRTPAVVRAVEPEERLVAPVSLEQALPMMQPHDLIECAVREYSGLQRLWAARQRVHVADVEVGARHNRLADGGHAEADDAVGHLGDAGGTR